MKDYVIVTTISTFRHRYVMHRDDLKELNAEVEPKDSELVDWACDTVTMEECEEFSQHHIGEQIVDTHVMSEAEMLELFSRDNPYLDSWPDEQKISWTRKNIHLKG